jgi:hypothetical protein
MGVALHISPATSWHSAAAPRPSPVTPERCDRVCLLAQKRAAALGPGAPDTLAHAPTPAHDRGRLLLNVPESPLLHMHGCPSAIHEDEYIGRPSLTFSVSSIFFLADFTIFAFSICFFRSSDELCAAASAPWSAIASPMPSRNTGPVTRATVARTRSRCSMNRNFKTGTWIRIVNLCITRAL